MTLADPWRKIGCSLGYKYLSWKFLLKIFFFFISFIFMQINSSLLPFKKIIYFRLPDFAMKNSLSYVIFCWFFCNYCTSANNFYVSSKDKISLKFCESFRFFLAVFMEKIKISRCVCETLTMPPAATKSKKLFLASRSKSRSQGHWPWCHLERASLAEYACQIWSLYLLRFKSYSEG